LWTTTAYNPVSDLAPKGTRAVVGGGGLELRVIGDGARHFELGVLAGIGYAEQKLAAIVGLRLGVAWSNVVVSVTPMLADVVYPSSYRSAPFAYASVLWRL
jgi:hypothetical protein